MFDRSDWDLIRFTAWIAASGLFVMTSMSLFQPRKEVPIQVSPPVELPIFVGKLSEGWQDWSWANHKLQAVDVIHDDHTTIKMTPDAFKGIYLHVDSLNTEKYKSLWIWVYSTGSTPPAINVSAASESKKFGPPVSLASVTPNGVIPPRKWTLAIVPLSELQASKTTITGFVLQDSLGKPQSSVYFADIKLVGDSEKATPIVKLEVDGNKDRHPISPYIYGLAHTSQDELTDLGIRSHRWGGNPNTRYNWEINAWNHARDWQFSNYGDADPKNRVPGSVADGHIMANRLAGAATVLTIPTIGYVAKDINDSSRSDGVPNEGGNALFNGSKAIKGYNPATNQIKTSVKSYARKKGPFQFPPNTSDGAVYQDEWVNHLVQKFGKADSGGVQFYAMDNEPDIWDSTHTDVHPVRMGYDQLLTTFLEYATAVKAVDPTAKVTGPVSWGWTGYFQSPKDRPDWNGRPDRKAHGDLPFIPWFLQQTKKHDDNTGKRILDVLDIHYYPQTAGVFEGKTDAQVNAARIRSVKSLWDPTYKDESWIGEQVKLIPRMKDWINQYYPGTKLGITEWNFGADSTQNGAVAIADTLGIFGKFDVFLANYWTAPKPKSPGYFAFKLFGNTDSAGTRFGDTSTYSSSSNSDAVSVFGSVDSKTNKPVIVLVNKEPGHDIPIELSLKSFPSTSHLSVWCYSEREPNHITKIQDVNISSGVAKFTVYRYGIYLLKGN